MATSIVRAGARRAARHIAHRALDLHVEGLQHLPFSGPVVIASHHFHHQWDGFALLTAISRPISFLVALDWLPYRWMRALMERACGILDWPVILRQDGPPRYGRSAYRLEEGQGYLRRASRSVVELLRGGGVVVIFPEAYPNVDPVFTLKESESGFLPFRAGFVRLVEWAQRDGGTRVAIVPVGFSYRRGERWQVTLRFGSPLYLDGLTKQADLVSTVEERVRTLSLP